VCKCTWTFLVPGAGLFIDETLDYIILEATSNESFQALSIEIRFSGKKHVICGVNTIHQIIYLNILRMQEFIPVRRF